MSTDDNYISSLTLSIESSESNDDININNTNLNNTLYKNKDNLDLFYELNSLLDIKNLILRVNKCRYLILLLNIH